MGPLDIEKDSQVEDDVTSEESSQECMVPATLNRQKNRESVTAKSAGFKCKKSRVLYR